MKSIMHKGLMAVSSLAVLLALGACGQREDVAAPEQRSDAASQVSPGSDTRTDTSAMGAAGEKKDGDQADTALGQKVDDAQIVAKIKTHFATDNDISAMAIDVDSKDGVVTLTGTVTNNDAKVRADEIAKGLPEVKSVNNQLEVKAG